MADNGDISLVTESDSDQLPDLIRSLKVDVNKNMASINSQLTGLTTTVTSLSSKMTDITDKCDQLVLENNLLKKSNADLQNRVTNLEKAIENIENQSTRSNLILDGIEGEYNEPWHVSEEKVRTVVRSDLGISEADEMKIERAHRLGSSSNNKFSPIIVKFTYFKDRQTVFRAAKENLGRRSSITIREDFSLRVRKQRKQLKRFMCDAREKKPFPRPKF